MTVLVVRAGSSVHRLGGAYRAPGPNTMGEAGKVYFAARMQADESAFSDGRSPPHYPSVHGVATHALVAAVGRVAELETEQLYAVGRAVSLVATVATLVLLAHIGLRLGLSPVSLAVAGLILLGTYPLVKHAASYRPDNWLWFLSVLAAWRLTRDRLEVRHLVLLAVLPALAFHVKSPGVVLAGITTLAVLLRRGLASAGFLALSQGAVLGLSVLVLERLSGGAYLAGLAGTGDVPISLKYVLGTLRTSDPIVWALLAGPLLVLFFLRRAPALRRERLRVLFLFWGGTLVAYGLSSARVGSATYYFLEPATYGLLLSTAGSAAWISYRRRASSAERAIRRPVAVASFVVIVMAFPSILPLAGSGRPPDLAQFRTERVAGFRSALAERINASDMYCYTDDPGLNVLLDNPAVIYPVLETQMMRSGFLPADNRLEPVRHRVFDCVALDGIRWSSHGRPAIGDAFYEAVREYYPFVERIGPYELRLPPAETLPNGASTDPDAP